MGDIIETLDKIRDLAREYNDAGYKHEDDCLGSLCVECGHCLHSVEQCDHDCGGGFGGCRNALDTDEVRIKRAALAMVETLERIESICRVSESGESPYRMARRLYQGQIVHTAQIRAALADLQFPAT